MVHRDFGELVTPLAIGAGAAYGATSVQVLPGEVLAFGGVVVATGLLALRGISKGDQLLHNLTVAWLFMTLAYLAVGATSGWSLRYVGGDTAIALLPLLIAWAFLSRPSWLNSTRGLWVLVGALAVSAMEARLVGQLLTRHDPPSALLIAGAWVLALRAQRLPVRIAGFALVALVGYLAWSSGYRTHMVLWTVAPFLIGWALGRFRRTALAVAIAAVVLLLAGVGEEVEQRLEASRFEAYVTGTDDASVSSRQAEWQDVRETAEREWLPANYILGYGFGATYEPRVSHIEANFTESGRVHSIHFGPGLVWYRFGLLGCALFLGALVLAARMLALVRRREFVTGDPTLVLTLSVGFGLFVLEFVVLNSTVQPAMSYCLGGLLAVWVAQRSELPDDDADRRSRRVHGRR